MLELDRLNIDNLTSLWKKMGLQTATDLANNGIKISRGWPHRYWLEWNATHEPQRALHDNLLSLPITAVIPVWLCDDNCISEWENTLLVNGYEMYFSQRAMMLDLQSVAKSATTELAIHSIVLGDAVDVWIETAAAAFGYPIDTSSIYRLVGEPNIRLLLVKKDNQPAATALVYKTDEVVGVHLVGVSDNYRGQGIARALMQYVIQLSIDLGGKYLTLQASAAGEPLYQQLGFVEQFLLRNYRRVS
jgi:GNAT superfamily N-acetyltransferase